ncbi:hypothetical protein V2S04_06305 [Microbacterium sp. OR21]|uniref:glycosyltransferase n=1 Tax=Microbacterium sp. OR21 TaxID=3095346 RepID=UPI0039B3EB62
MTHLLNESNIPLGVDPREGTFVDQVAAWSARGVASAVVFHGSDARDPMLSMEASQDSYFHDVPRAWRVAQGEKAARNRAQVLDSGLPVFVTTPDLLSQVNGAKLLPLTVDVATWDAPLPETRGRKLRVLHQPSQRNPDIKGTRFIDPVLRELDAAGAIEYVHAGIVSRESMRALIRSVDVVVDQLRSGSYGVTAVEAMASGRIVVANISEATIATYGEDTPVVNCAPSALRDALRDLSGSSPDAVESRARASREYATRWHDGRAAASALDGFLAGDAAVTHG